MKPPKLSALEIPLSAPILGLTGCDAHAVFNGGTVMSANVVFSSPYYQVVEYPELDAIELVDNVRATGAWIRGDMAAVLRSSLQDIFARQPTAEEVDEVIGGYEALMNLPVCYH